MAATAKESSPMEKKPTLTPPSSGEAEQMADDSSSDLTDIDLSDNEGNDDNESNEDIGEIEPAEYWQGGNIPIFRPVRAHRAVIKLLQHVARRRRSPRPDANHFGGFAQTMDQFRSFKKYIDKIDKYGMKAGIVKVIPPKEWRDALPPLDEAVKTIKVKNPIEQDFGGSQGIYTQANIEKQRSYNLPQWKALCEESSHQPPARRGERRRNQDKVRRSGAGRARSSTVDPSFTRARDVSARASPEPKTSERTAEARDQGSSLKNEVPPTPSSPNDKPEIKPEPEDADNNSKLEVEELEPSPSKPRGRQPKSVSSRRRNNRRDAADIVDEAAFENFDYHLDGLDEFTPERCRELEAAYWKSVTFNKPIYGADMPGSLFDENTTSWNVAHLENLLDVLGQKIPGVNTTYLYLGMWKASFAWHLEDVDLYSINYIHFGAPKQWYSISQADARRFEAAMKSKIPDPDSIFRSSLKLLGIWPNDAKNCSQFLRHKTYLISPALLQSQFNIKVNRLVHNEGEFVITYPYGYHSGYNLGYNCAESVNFATESWLEYGRIAKKCDCEHDSVWVDAEEIGRKFRGEPTPEYFEETDEDEDDDEDDQGATDLPTPPASVKGKPNQSRKRKRDTDDKGSKSKVRRVRIPAKAPAQEPCALCPNDIPAQELLSTDNGKMAHRICALYTPETYIEEESGKDIVRNVANIDKARLDLKCNFCRSKRGACFQCSQKKCTRAYHATCAAAAGVQVDIGDVPVFSEDGIEYTDTGIDFRCRFHRSKRGKNVDGFMLEEDTKIKEYAGTLKRDDVVQMQYYQGEIFAGVVVENRPSEETLLVDIIPKGDRIELEYKWVLMFDPADSQLPKPSANAKPLPSHIERKTCNAPDRLPVADDPFCDAEGPHVWSEFNTAEPERNPAQVKIDFSTPNQVWHYLGRDSTEARPKYTEDLTKPRHNPSSNFLDTVKPARPAVTSSTSFPRQSYPATYPTSAASYPRANGTATFARQQHTPAKTERAYEYKPKSSIPSSLGNSVSRPATQATPPSSARTPQTYNPTQVAQPQRQYHQQQQAPVANMSSSSTTSSPSPKSRTSKSGNSTPRKSTPARQQQAGARLGGAVSNHALAKYPFYRSSFENHLRKYESPYATKGGFTLPWTPSQLQLQQEPEGSEQGVGSGGGLASGGGVGTYEGFWARMKNDGDGASEKGCPSGAGESGDAGL
ncbi:MAG: hypothetical protein M1819_005157 [Sarea resinae]|nr:MAG: hypothetical protein M1819_005157 [Sarea resinae]